MSKQIIFRAYQKTDQKALENVVGKYGNMTASAPLKRQRKWQKYI